MMDIRILEGTARKIQSEYKNIVKDIYVNQIADCSLFDKAIKVYVYFKDGTKMTRIINNSNLSVITSLLDPSDYFRRLVEEMIEVKTSRMNIDGDKNNTKIYIDKVALANHFNDLAVNGIINCIKKPIEKVIFNDPATIVFWTDGTKTVVKAHDEKYDPEKGLAMAIAKKHLGNQGNYYNTFTKWLPNETDEEIIAKLKEALKEIRARSKANKKG